MRMRVVQQMHSAKEQTIGKKDHTTAEEEEFIGPSRPPRHAMRGVVQNRVRRDCDGICRRPRAIQSPHDGGRPTAVINEPSNVPIAAIASAAEGFIRIESPLSHVKLAYTYFICKKNIAPLS